MTTRGSFVHNSMVEFSGASKKIKFYAIFSENWWFQTKRFTGLLELVQLYKQNPLEKFFIFTIYQTYTLAFHWSSFESHSVRIPLDNAFVSFDPSVVDGYLVGMYSFPC